MTITNHMALILAVSIVTRCSMEKRNFPPINFNRPQRSYDQLGQIRIVSIHAPQYHYR